MSAITLKAPSPKSGGGMPLKTLLLNLLSVLCVVGAVAMFGKSCWITMKAEVSQVLLHRAFEQSIATGEPTRPWGWADTWPVAELTIARIGQSAIVLHGATTEALAFGPTHLPDTPEPGERGTSVMSAHRDTHFAFLRDVRLGDDIAIRRNDGLTFHYRVINMRVAPWNDSKIDRHAKGFNLVLSTCYPFDGLAPSNQRYIVEARMTRS